MTDPAEIRADGRRLLTGPRAPGWKKSLRALLWEHADVLLADPAPVGRDDVAHDEGWAIAIISNVDAPEVGWPHQTEEWRTAARSWLDAVHAPAPVGLTEAERLHMTNLREAWRRAAPVYTDLAATDVEWLCTLIDRLVPVSPSVDPEEKP